MACNQHRALKFRHPTTQKARPSHELEHLALRSYLQEATVVDTPSITRTPCRSVGIAVRGRYFDRHFNGDRLQRSLVVIDL